MAVRSTTARRLATVIVATAAVSALGTGAASAASTPAPSTTSTQEAPQVGVPPLSVPQVGSLLDGLLGTVDGLLGDQLGVRTAAEIEADKDEPVLSKTVDNLTRTTKELPLLGGAVGGLTDSLGLSEPTRVAETPTAPTPAKPAKPAVVKPGSGKIDRAESIADPGSTWTTPMQQAPAVQSVVRNEEKPSPGGLPGLIDDIRSIFPSNAAEAAAAGAGAATVALIVLGGVAVTGAAGAASAAGRRGLINGSVGGSL